VSLVRLGFFPATAMVYMVERDRSYQDFAERSAENNPPMRLRTEEQRARTPAYSLPHRLISDSDYSDKMQTIARAEGPSQA
jgi:hypothetical protein